jgi:hypothetical protein
LTFGNLETKSAQAGAARAWKAMKKRAKAIGKQRVQGIFPL